MGLVPLLEGLDGGDVAERLLWQMLVVEPDVAMQRRLRVLGAVEVVRPEHLHEPPVEALDPAVGLRVLGPREPVFDAQGRAQRVELVLATGVALAPTEGAVGELAAVVGKQRVDLERRGLVQGIQERPRRRGRLAALDGDEYPARGPVNGDEHVTPGRLVGQLRQGLHVEVNIARRISLERRGRRLGDFRPGQPGVPATAQQPVERRAAHPRLDELVHHGQQVIERQPQVHSQVHHHLFLRRVEGGVQPVRGVAGVLHRRALSPPAEGVAAHVKLPRQLVVTARGLLDRRTNGRRGGGVLVQGNPHVVPPSLPLATTARSTSRPISSGRLLCST